MADKLAKEAAKTSLIDITFSRIPLSLVNHDIQTAYKKMAKRMAKLHQGADNETILPVSRGKVKEKD
jgi:hypothetical protein